MLLDTTVLSDVIRGQAEVRRRLTELEGEGCRHLTTAISVYEASLAAHRQSSAAEREKLMGQLSRFLQGVVTLPFDLEAAQASAQTMAELYRRGRPAAALDLFVAECGKRGGCEAVLTRNVSQFRRLGILDVLTY